jgi:3-oxoacyl-[acyl-carrier protein] reductase
MDLRLEGRSAIIGASSRGLGHACAEALLREGVDVLVTGRGKRASKSRSPRLLLSGAVASRGSPAT